MADANRVLVSCSQRDGSTLEVVGELGSNLAAKSGYVYNLKYKIGATGSYTTIVQRALPSNSNEPDISLESWKYKFNVPTDDIIYLQLIVTNNLSVDYIGTSQAIGGVSYVKAKSSRASKTKKNIATSNATRKEYPSF
jgi:hypothetical protein